MSGLLLASPFIAWLVGGSTKFVVNSVREKRLSFDLIGYGGLPSNHATIVSTVATLIFLESRQLEVQLLAIALGFIVCMDAMGLRKQIAKQAVLLNQVAQKVGGEWTPVRERVAHSPLEIVSGLLLGILVGYLIHVIHLA